MGFFGFFNSTIGKKIIVALTGAFMFLFLIGHLLGNLEMFAGPDAINEYAVLLRTFPKVLWGFRIGLIVSIVLHVACTISLTTANRAKNPMPYAVKTSRKANLSSKTMMVSGITVLVFVAYHLAHYTFTIVDPSYARLLDDQGRHHVYNMVVLGFSHPLVSGFYVIAQCLLGFHLSHGISSMGRTLGYTHKETYEKIRRVGQVIAAT